MAYSRQCASASEWQLHVPDGRYTHTHTNRRVGPDHSASAVHRPRRIRGKMVPGKAEGLPAAESLCVLHADGSCTLRPDSCRESDRHHVNRLPETGSDYPALRIRASRPQVHLSVAERTPGTCTNGHCSNGRGRARFLSRRLTPMGNRRKREDTIME